MYHEKMVCTIKSNGKVLREVKGKVFLPFNTEFTILLKNLNSKRAKVKITIDDEDVLNGHSLIVNANSDLELKRFLTEHSDSTGPKFKFVEKTDEIREFRGENDGMDGIVRIEFQFEQQAPKIDFYPCYQPPVLYSAKDVFCSSDTKDGGCYNATANERRFDPNNPQPIGSDLFSQSFSQTTSSLKNEDGMTVKGEAIKQEFQTVFNFNCEAELHVICIQLKGNVNNNQVESSFTVHNNRKCKKCGFVNPWTANFCNRCGSNTNYY